MCSTREVLAAVQQQDSSFTPQCGIEAAFERSVRCGFNRKHARCVRESCAGDGTTTVLLCCRRWLEYEEAHGSAADVEGVKQRAMDYMRAQETA
jgi:hypothetical protein